MSSLLFLIFAFSATLYGGVERNIEYARVGDTHLLLDAQVPEGPGPYAAVLIVHGGGWSAGDKIGPERILFPLFAGQRIAAFSIDYRLAPTHPYPAAIQDVLSAIGFLREHASRFRIRPDRLILLGESAGGHLVSLIGARDGRDLGLWGVISFYGRQDLVKGAAKPGAARDAIETFLQVKASDRRASARLREASPISWVRPGLPPFLTLHGTGDTTVPHVDSVRMCDAIRQAGGRCELRLVPGAPHGVSHWTSNESWRSYQETLTAWLQKRLSEEEK
jgi:acetyl esterase